MRSWKYCVSTVTASQQWSSPSCCYPGVLLLSDDSPHWSDSFILGSRRGEERRGLMVVGESQRGKLYSPGSRLVNTARTHRIYSKFVTLYWLLAAGYWLLPRRDDVDIQESDSDPPPAELLTGEDTVSTLILTTPITIHRYLTSCTIRSAVWKSVFGSK